MLNKITQYLFGPSRNRFDTVVCLVTGICFGIGYYWSAAIIIIIGTAISVIVSERFAMIVFDRKDPLEIGDSMTFLGRRFEITE
jgi:3-isopropylmalate dehydratase small subunit